MRKLLPVLALGVYFLVLADDRGKIVERVGTFIDKASCEKAMRGYIAINNKKACVPAY